MGIQLSRWQWAIYTNAHHWWVCTSPWGPPLLLKHLSIRAFSVRPTRRILYFPSVTRRLLVVTQSAHRAFLLRAFNPIATFTFPAIAFAFTSMSSASSAFRWLYCFCQWLSAIWTCSACSDACRPGNQGSSSSSLDAWMLYSFFDTSCVIPLGDWVKSIQRFAEAICSTPACLKNCWFFKTSQLNNSGFAFIWYPLWLYRSAPTIWLSSRHRAMNNGEANTIHVFVSVFLQMHCTCGNGGPLRYRFI
jgi:hypothetical protein